MGKSVVRFRDPDVAHCSGMTRLGKSPNVFANGKGIYHLAVLIQLVLLQDQQQFLQIAKGQAEPAMLYQVALLVDRDQQMYLQADNCSINSSRRD